MEYFGLIAFALILAYSNYPSKIKKLEKEIKLLKRSLKGGSKMTKLLSNLKGQKCIITFGELNPFPGRMNIECEISDSDEEWVRISLVDKKGGTLTKIIRIETINTIELI